MFSRFTFPSFGASLIVAFTATALTASAQVTFSTHTYPNSNLWTSNGGQNTAIRADLNGDGREDFISENEAAFNSGCSGSFAVTLSTGDGTYAAPVCYTIPSGVALLFAVGDFYGTGVVDVAVSNEVGGLFIYKNNGGGTLTLASNYAFPNEIGAMIAADTNHDGHIDLVYLDQTNSGVFSLHTLFGNGDGTFTTGPVSPAGTVFNGPYYMLTGDFDGDGHADVMIINHILYGDGKGNFVSGPYANSTESYQTVDIDNDGLMELIGTPGTFNSSTLSTTFYNYLDLVWAYSNRTIGTQRVPLKSCAETTFPAQAADFDGDGIPDLIIAEDSNCKGAAPYTLNFMKGNGNGTFQGEQVLYSTSDSILEWHVLRASHSSKPDLTVWQYLDVNRTITNPEQLVLVNTTAGNFPTCTPPNSRAIGINVCGLTSTVAPTSPVSFSFAGTNQTPGRDMELWIDGKKVAENLKNTYTYHDFLNGTQALSAGQHEIAVFSVGWDYSLLLDQFTLNVGSTTCAVPTYTGLNVCAPIQNSTVGSPVTAWAAGNAGGPITRMEVWVDGVKEYSTFGSNTLKTQLTVAPGRHQFAYFLVSTNGTKWLDIVYADVQ